jgi:class 3 adenylate cyclase/tetratricopeptide (TPR) repeat protein
MATGPVTLLFTDLVNSTELLQRVGDERAQRILRAHHRLLRDALAVHGGREEKWLGDGMMTTFSSAADAVRCAVTMQQTARRRAAGERLGLRVGLHVGEALREESDWFGTPVVLARRLCEGAQAGQILCSSLVVELLRGRQAFRFQELRPLELKGFAAAAPAYEVAYRPDDPAALLPQTPFAGRATELARLERRLEQARAGHGGVVMLVGEPGIGKTRTLEEVAETARAQGALVLWGRCYEGEAGRPYGPFAEALAEYARIVAPDALHADLRLGAAPLARLVPVLRERLPDIPEPVGLQPEEERVRLLDAVTQCLLAVAARTPMVLVLDDLHWADQGTVSLLRHVARFAPRGRLLVLGAYRDVEVDGAHPLADALGVLPRETTYEQLGLAGLDAAAVRELLEAVADQEVPQPLVDTITRETSGNPFFIREVLRHLVETGTLVREGGRWTARTAIEEMRLPDTVRQVIERRLGRLSDAARRLLEVAAAFTETVHFAVARRVAGLEEARALDALDEALGAQLLTPTVDPDRFDFAHALVRHTLYGAQSPPRQVRLHRQIAEAMEHIYGSRASEHATEIARHWHRSAGLPGAERGVPYCLAAAEQAERSAAFTDTAAHLRAALELLLASAPEHMRIQARLGLALVWALQFDDAVATARDAASRIAKAENPYAAADYLARVVIALDESGGELYAGPLARQGLEYVGERRDATWASLKVVDIIERESNDPSGLGMPLDTPERREIAAILEQAPAPGSEYAPTIAPARSTVFGLPILNFSSRAEIEARHPDAARYVAVGQYRRGLRLHYDEATQNAHQGRIGNQVLVWTNISRLHIALGEFEQAREALQRSVALAEHLPESSRYTVAVLSAEDELRMATDEGWDTPLVNPGPGLNRALDLSWYRTTTQASIARTHARMGRVEQAIRRLSSVLPAIAGAPVWTEVYTRLVCDAAETLWLTERIDGIDVIERNLRAKVIEPDFHYVMMDGRLALARLCALQQGYDEAIDWFAKARAVLDEQGARPLRAIVDYDEALMYARRDCPGDRERALPLLNTALTQFRDIGMPGWIRRAEALCERCQQDRSSPERRPEEAPPSAHTPSPTAAAPSMPSGVCVFRREGEYWTIAYEDTVCRLKDAKGLHYLAQLLRHPGREFHVLDLVQGAGIGDRRSGAEERQPEPSDQGLPILDERAKATYRQRLSDLREELAEAERFHDAGRTARAREEIDAITQQLAAGIGLGGRDRIAASAAERARTTVTQGIRSALKKIGDAIPALGDQLAPRIRTGAFCVYLPDAVHPISWTL